MRDDINRSYIAYPLLANVLDFARSAGTDLGVKSIEARDATEETVDGLSDAKYKFIKYIIS